MNISQINPNQKILIYGYGLEGKSSQKFCEKHYPENEITIYDEKVSAYKNSVNFVEFGIIIVSPGIDRFTKIPKQFWHKCTSNVEIFFHRHQYQLNKIIGIAGTKGKSTTTKFCAEFLTKSGKKVEIGGNFGVPFLDLSEKLLAEEIDFIVAELSSFQLEFLKISPHIAIFMNLFPDHLDRHSSLDSYFKAKQNLFAHQTSDDFLITPKCWQNLVEKTNPQSKLILSSPMSDEYFPENSVFRASHFLENFGTIIELAKVLKIENYEKVLEKTAQKFVGLEHRTEFFAEKNGLKFYDDSISTNPDTAIAAVKFFGSDLSAIIIGGQFSGDNFDEFIAIMEEFAPQSLILICKSSAGDAVLKSIKKTNTEVKNIVVEDIAEAVEKVFNNDLKGTVCLLSPASRSFDKFNNYKERGEHFKKCVRDF